MRVPFSRPRRQINFCVAAALAMVLGLAGTAVSARPEATIDGATRSSASTRPNIAERVRNSASDMVHTAMNFLGVPYKLGGDNEADGFDCSGFTRHIFEMSMGLVLPRKVDQQAHAPGLFPVSRDELRPGDLVFFNTLKRTFSHVGIYVGEGKFIHAPRAGGEVRVEEMTLDYWRKRFTGARRATAMADGSRTVAAADSRSVARPVRRRPVADPSHPVPHVDTAIEDAQDEAFDDSLDEPTDDFVDDATDDDEAP